MQRSIAAQASDRRLYAEKVTAPFLMETGRSALFEVFWLYKERTLSCNVRFFAFPLYSLEKIGYNKLQNIGEGEHLLYEY